MPVKSPTTNAATIAASGDDLSAGAEVFSFASPVSKIIVANNSEESLLVLFGSEDATDAVYDVVCGPGLNIASWPGAVWDKCSIYCGGSVTFGADFNVRGVPYVG